MSIKIEKKVKSTCSTKTKGKIWSRKAKSKYKQCIYYVRQTSTKHAIKTKLYDVISVCQTSGTAIKDKDVTQFTWKTIVYRFIIPQSIITDNGP